MFIQSCIYFRFNLHMRYGRKWKPISEPHGFENPVQNYLMGWHIPYFDTNSYDHPTSPGQSWRKFPPTPSNPLPTWALAHHIQPMR